MSVSTYNLIVFGTCLFFSGFFSAAETAFTAINRIKIHNLITQNPRRANTLKSIYKSPRRLITSILIGNNVANVGASATATAMLLVILAQMGVESVAVAMFIITAIVTITLLIIGEITPKTIALRHPERVALLFSAPMHIILRIFTPLVLIFELVSKVLIRIFRFSGGAEDRKIITAEEIQTMLQVSKEEGVLEKNQNAMLNNIFEFSDTVVREIMTPRTDAIVLSAEKSVQDAIHLIMEAGHSRIPIYEERIDNIIGIIYAKDLLSISKESRIDTVKKFIRPANFIPESKNIEELLNQMKVARFHMAIVLDEYGGMAGLVTLEDIIEEILGEIQDEYDHDEKPEVQKLSDLDYNVDANIHIKDLSEALDIDIEENEDYDTLGGMVLSILGKLPSRGEVIETDYFKIKIKEVKKHRIINMAIELYPPNTNDDDESNTDS